MAISPTAPPPIRILKHEAVPGTGSYEVRFADGRPSRFFYWDDLPGRRLRDDVMTSAEAGETAKKLARAERDRLPPVGPVHGAALLMRSRLRYDAALKSAPPSSG